MQKKAGLLSKKVTFLLHPTLEHQVFLIFCVDMGLHRGGKRQTRSLFDQNRSRNA